MNLPEMPAKLRQRPKFKGMPIPFTTFVMPDGTPDFKVVDEYNRLLCIERRRCGLCGQDLKFGKPMVFIGGNQSCESGMFIDPAMHEECAKYAAKVCPYLAVTQKHSERESPNAMAEYAGATADRPAGMGIYYCNGYQAIASGDAIYIRAHQATKIDYDTIPVAPERSDGRPKMETPAEPAGPQALDFVPPSTTGQTAGGDQGAT